MNITELNSKISNSIEELKKDIIEYVKQNAKLKIGDIVETPYNLGDKITYSVITQIGFDKNYGITYRGNKVKKDTGEVSFQSMMSSLDASENCLRKTTLIIKKKEISRIEDSIYFNYDIFINVKF